MKKAAVIRARGVRSANRYDQRKKKKKQSDIKKPYGIFFRHLMRQHTRLERHSSNLAIVCAESGWNFGESHSKTECRQRIPKSR